MANSYSELLEADMYSHQSAKQFETPLSTINTPKVDLSIFKAIAKFLVKAVIFTLKLPFIVVVGLLRTDELEDARRRNVDNYPYRNFHRF
jgi:hypothetical protein